MKTTVVRSTADILSAVPLCPVFGACGGCAYQNISYPEELWLKQRQLVELMRRRLGISERVFKKIVASPEPYGYRHRLDITLKRSQGGVLFGFQAPGQRKMIPVEACPIARPEVSDFLPVLREQALERFPEKYRTANLVIKTGDDSRVFWGGIGRHSLELEPENYLWTKIHGKRIFYSLDTFFQANLGILHLLMDKIRILSGLDSKTLFFDLYSGVGLFGVYFADAAGEVIAIEDCAASVKVMHHNIAYQQLAGKVRVVQGKVEEELPKLMDQAQAERKVAVIDPPRGGLHPKALETLTQMKSFETLLYLSCHPESLIRDLEQFLKAGWRIDSVTPFDFFPRTAHLETLVLLRPPLDFSGLFKNHNPVEVELGCGKGRFLIGRAEENPQINFLGIDWAGKWMNIGKSRGEKRNLPNLRFLKMDASEAVNGMPDDSVSVFHIYFPDPWPKRRHRKRRLLSLDFLKLIHRKLAPGGRLEYATDFADYFREVKQWAGEIPELWSRVKESVNERIAFPYLKTNYELKYQTQGRTLYYLEMEKR